MSLFLSFIIGAALGSFLNVLIDRLSTGRQFLKGRSYCEHCRKTLQPIDLIPVVSYLMLRGKCRFCKAKIPFRIFLVEVFCGFVLSFIFYHLTISTLSLDTALFLALIIFSFIGIFVADVVYGIIPDLMVISSVVGIAGFIFLNHSPLLNHLFSSLGAGLFFFFLFLVTRGRGMGFGDVKFAFVLGLLLGFPMTVIALYLAFLTGASVAIILVIWKKLRFFGGTIPFGPFLVGSTLVALFYGNTLLQMFTTQFLK